MNCHPVSFPSRFCLCEYKKCLTNSMWDKNCVKWVWEFFWEIIAVLIQPAKVWTTCVVLELLMQNLELYCFMFSFVCNCVFMKCRLCFFSNSNYFISLLFQKCLNLMGFLKEIPEKFDYFLCQWQNGSTNGVPIIWTVTTRIFSFILISFYLILLI